MADDAAYDCHYDSDYYDSDYDNDSDYLIFVQRNKVVVSNIHDKMITI